MTESEDTGIPQGSDKDEIKSKEAHPETAIEETERQVEQNVAEKASEGQTEAKIILEKDLLTGGQVSWPITIKGNPHLLVAGLPGMERRLAS